MCLQMCSEAGAPSRCFLVHPGAIICKDGAVDNERWRPDLIQRFSNELTDQNIL